MLPSAEIRNAHCRRLIERIERLPGDSVFVAPRLKHRQRLSSVVQNLRIDGSAECHLSEIAELSRRRTVLLVGDPGSGKSTCLKQLALSEAQRGEFVPLFLRIASHAPGTSLSTSLAQQNQLQPHELQALTADYPTVLIVDQLNELGAKQKQALEDVVAFANRNLQMSLVLATRTSSYPEIRSPTLQTVEILPFSKPAIRRYQEEVLGEQHAAKLEALLDRRMRALCRNPLLLSMIVTLFDETGEVPHGRSRLFEDFTSYLLTKWDIHADEPPGAYFLDEVLVAIAGGLNPAETSHNALAIDRLIARATQDLNRRDGTAVAFEEIRKRVYSSALLTSGSNEGRCSFVHQLFQEYYASRSLLQRLISKELNLSDIRELSSKEAWHEPLFFLCGSLRDPESLLTYLVEQGKLVLAAECLDNAPNASPHLCDQLIVYLLNAYKYTDLYVAPNEAVGYNILRALRLVADRASPLLESRVGLDVQFFLDKYLQSTKAYAAIGSDEVSTESLLFFLRAESSWITKGDIVRTLAIRKAREASCVIRSYVTDRHCSFRDEAIWAFGELCSAVDTDVLLACVRSGESTQVVAAACNALVRAEMRSRDDPENPAIDAKVVADHLTAFIDDPASVGRESAGYALVTICGHDAKDVILRHMQGGADPRHRGMFVFLAGELHLEDAASLLPDLFVEESSAHVREDIVRTTGQLLERIPSEDSLHASLTELLTLALLDTDSVVRLHAVLSLRAVRGRNIDTLVSQVIDDSAVYVRHAAQGVIAAANGKAVTWQPFGNWRSDLDMTTLEKTLVAYGARAAAIESALEFLEREYQSGRIDIGRTMQLRTTYGQDRLVLLNDIERTLREGDLHELDMPIAFAKQSSSKEIDEQIRLKIEHVAEEKGWGTHLRERIRAHKGDITGLIVSVAIELAKRSGLG